MKLILGQVPGLHHREIDSGCCGMAGAFGYEHHDLSQKIGEDRLFPAIRARSPGTQIVACGISCRHQIHDFLGVEARHWVEVCKHGGGRICVDRADHAKVAGRRTSITSSRRSAVPPHGCVARVEIDISPGRDSLCHAR